jgi:tetratricopeptide (TPR) repeat protein/cold shock CspA family protein
LVGLHQATYGRDLEDIVFEEYANIVPRLAQMLYLDVCTLHRLGVPVRAGLISRVTGVAFKDFREKLLKPLEHVVRVEHYSKVADYVYRSRHQDIAEIVFRKVLVDPVAKSDQLIRIVSCLSIDYSIDRQSMLDIIGSRGLAESFADKSLGHRVIDAARLAGLDLESVEQHRALFEVHHPSGDVRAAFAAIERAIAASGHHPSRTTLHVKAVVLRRLAGLPGVSEVERDKRRHEAVGILSGLMADQRDPHPFHVKAEILLDDLQERLDAAGDLADPVAGRQVAEIVRDAERTLQQGGQLFPGNSYIATASSRLADILENHPKALSILETAFRQNQQNAFVAIRLARQYGKKRDFSSGIEVLRRAVSLNPNNKDVHYMLAQMLGQEDEHKNQTEIGQHLRKSFSDGDNRYDARLYFARHQYLYGDRVAARREFEQPSRVPLPPQELSSVRGIIKDSHGDVIMYSGEVTQKRDGYCFVRCHALGDDVFIHASQFDRETWSGLTSGEVVSFGLGFSLKGVQGTRAMI